MVRHVILWTLKPDLAEPAAVKAGIKNGLEGLQGRIPGLLKIAVAIRPLPTSNADVMLDALFADAEALKGYASHPEHLAVANSAVRPFTQTRTCLDFVVEN